MGGTVWVLTYSKAPWWGIALVTVVLSVASAGVAAVRLLLPQNSRDRLQWWRDLHQYCTERAQHKNASRESRPYHVPDAKELNAPGSSPDRPAKSCAEIMDEPAAAGAYRIKHRKPLD